MLVVLLVLLGIISEDADCAPSIPGGPSVPLPLGTFSFAGVLEALGPCTAHVRCYLAHDEAPGAGEQYSPGAGEQYSPEPSLGARGRSICSLLSGRMNF